MEFTRCLRCMQDRVTYPCPHCGYDPRTEKAKEYVLRPGAILNGKYVVGALLGQGGFGITYIGWDLALDSRVAIKEYFPSGQAGRNGTGGVLQWYSSPQAEAARDMGTEMFLKEARKMSRVREIPQVVHIRDLFQQNDTAYIVMDFVEGETLMARLKKTGPLSWEDAKEIFFPAIRAMELVHKEGLVHRDLSPDNLMLLPDGGVKILDLGAAKDLNVNSGASSMQVAKSGFSPLEQYSQRGSSGPWTDVYAMAATMYYALTGVLPPNAVDRVDEDPIRWDLPQLAALPKGAIPSLKQALTVSPKARTQNMEEFLKQLEAATPDIDSDSDSDSDPSPDFKRLPAAIAVVLAVALVAGCLLSRQTKISRQKPQPEAVAQTDFAVQTVAPLETEAIVPTEPESTVHLAIQEQTICCGWYHTVAIKEGGTVVATGNSDNGQCDVSDWNNIVAVAAGWFHSVGLKADGTVVATGWNGYGQCDVSGWSDIVAVTAGDQYTVGLKANGTVVATGDTYYGQCNVSDWTDIVAVTAGDRHTVGLKANGTVVAAGDNGDGQCNVSHWTDIVAIAAGGYHTIGLKADGTVMAAGSNGEGQCNVPYWTDIVAVTAGDYHTVGLKADGTAVAVGSTDSGQRNVFDWTNIVAVTAGYYHTVGLKADGTLIATGSNVDGQCNISDWTDIRIPGTSASVPEEELSFTHTDDPINFVLQNGKAVDGTIRELDRPLENCNAITACVEISNLDHGNVEGEWGLWIRKLNGEWMLVDTFGLEGTSAYAQLEFDSPVSFDAWTCLCHCLGDSWSFSCRIWLQDARRFHYSWER